MTIKTYSIHVITRDSLGHKISEYDSRLNGEDYRRLLSDAEFRDGHMVTIKDVQIDDELGYREIYLT